MSAGGLPATAPPAIALAGPNSAPAGLAFDFEGAKVRAISRAGEVWFVASDVAAVLGIGRTDDAVRRLDDDERGTDTIRTPGGPQRMGIINESGLYCLILSSRKAQARRFRKWVTAEVIPAIRRAGGYMMAAPDETPAELVARALRVAQDAIDRQKAQLAAVTPKAEALERIAAAGGSLSITEAAKALKVAPKFLFGWLVDQRWIYRRGGAGIFLAYQDRLVAGLLDQIAVTIETPGGGHKVTERVRVTGKGLARLASLLAAKDGAQEESVQKKS